MAEVATEQFYQSLRASPSGQKQTGTIFDELHGAMQTSQNPLDRTIQMISETHGPWSGGSKSLFNFTTMVASILNVPVLTLLSNKIGNAACAVEKALSLLPPSFVGRGNTLTGATMNTALLREFVTTVQNMHPAINEYIAMHQDTFPYFAPTSEEVGSFAYITIRETETDPSKWGKKNNSGCLDNNSRIHKNQTFKMIPSIHQGMDTSNRLVNTMFVRNLQGDNNMAVLRPNYGGEHVIVHGHNFTMDVFHAGRRKNAVPGSLAALMELMGDLIRLINKFFCLLSLGKYELETFNITFAQGGPNDSPLTIVVDNKGRLISTDSKPNTVNDPTNDKMINAKTEHKQEKQ